MTRRPRRGDERGAQSDAWDSELLPQHERLIDGSSISTDVARERGYRSVTVRSELGRLGFGESQRRVPALLIPVRGVSGDIVSYQIRPDEPRISQKGKAIKYETPRGSRMALDVPPRCRKRGWIGNPEYPLIVTEGARKADAAVSQGLCCIALLGVWNWRGSNEDGGKVALADWDSIALKGRDVSICFDSDVTTKPAVRAALARLKAFLESRNASVRIICLPAADGGAKVGLDDFFANGGTKEQLFELARDEVPLDREAREDAASTEYFVDRGSTFWNRPDSEGNPAPCLLANFDARVTRDVRIDDGLETRHEFELEIRLGEHLEKRCVPANAYAAMAWPETELGARAIVQPGAGVRDRLRVAILTLSKGLATATMYGHTGWRDLSGVGMAYLHAGGAIGPKGAVADVEVALPEALRGGILPAPPNNRRVARQIHAALDFAEIGPSRVTFPLLAAVFRAALGESDFSVFLHGPTGSFKTELAACVQSFFGAGFNARNLPASWLSTPNALETLGFIAKDMLLVIDDFVPGGSTQDVQRQSAAAERILRAQGNRSGRTRLRADTSLRAGRAPRGMFLVTGEDLPGRHSARARALILELGASDVDLPRLTEVQGQVAHGTFAKVMSAFLQYVAADYENMKLRVRSRAAELREELQADDRHRRTASTAAELQAGFELFSRFCVATEALDSSEAEALNQRCSQSLSKAAELQGRHLRDAEPVELFLRLLRSAINSGIAHVAGSDGDEPEELSKALGWRPAHASQIDPDKSSLRPQGARVGWVDEDDLYLDADAALKAAQQMAGDSERIAVSAITLAKRLFERGCLVSTDQRRGHLRVRRTLERRRIDVLHLEISLLTGSAHSAQTTRSVSSRSERRISVDPSESKRSEEASNNGALRRRSRLE